LFKPETVPGTFANPAGANDAQLVFGYEVTPMESEEVRRAIERPFPGINPSTYTAIRARHRFSVELSGSGTPTTPAKWGQLLQACLFGAAVPAVAKVGYPLDSVGDGGAGSIAGYKDNARHRAKMARGNAVFRFQERQLPSIQFDFQALIEGASPMDASAPAGVVLPTYPVPVEVNLANTVITLGGTVLGVRSLEIDLGNKVEFFSTTGGRAIIFGKDDSGDRRAITGQAVFELPDPAVKNYFTDIIPRTRLAFSLVHGTAAGNIVRITSANAVLGRATYSVEQNRIFMNCPIEFVPTAANSDLVLETE
jgi:hypothetical protein